MKIITEMSVQRAKAIDYLERYNYQRIKHLLLVYFYTNNDAVNHWLDEICAWCEDSYRIKPNNKLLDKDTIYETIWLNPKDWLSKSTINTFIKNMHSRKGLAVIKTYDYSAVEKYLEEYFKWLSDQLSKTDLVSDDLIRNKILQLISKYK